MSAAVDDAVGDLQSSRTYGRLWFATCERFAGAFKVVSELSWGLKKIRLNCFGPRDVNASHS